MTVRGDGRLRVVLVGTGTGVGKTHVACALLGAWSERQRVVGLKPIETGVGPELPGRARNARDTNGGGLASAAATDQQRLCRAARLFHVKRRDGDRGGLTTTEGPTRSLFAFPDPISPHLAARRERTRIDLGLVERWVRTHEAPITIVETAGGLFSPLGNGATNFELTQALRPDAVLLVASDRLGVLHELTTTIALAAARAGPPLGVVLSAPAADDASTGHNAAEILALGIARPAAVFPRAPLRASATVDAARRVIAWIENGLARTQAPTTE